jgi:hypothetical protein
MRASMISNVLFYAGICLVFLLLLRSQRFQRANILDATAGSLAAIRIVTSLVMLVFLIGEDYPSIALLPREGMHYGASVRWLLWLPLFENWHAQVIILHALTWVTAFFLLCSLFGWRSRLSAGLGGLGCLLLGGIARQYMHFFHTGLVPMVVLLILAFTPCGDALSFDRRFSSRRRALPLRSAGVYGWSRFACWCAIALPYTDAVLSKLRTGTLDWIQADSIRCHLFTDCLLEKGYDCDGALYLLHAPDWLFSVLGASVIAIELSAVFLLFSPRVRAVVPWLLVTLHAGVFLLHNVPFFDLMVMPLLFIDWFRFSRKPPEISVGGDRAIGAKGLSLVVILMVLLPWKHRVEYYPLTGWGMYRTIQLAGVVNYATLKAVLASGKEEPFDPGRFITILHRGQHRLLLVRFAFDPHKRAVFSQLLATCARLHNTKAPPGEEILGFLMERRTWNFRENRDDPHFGTTVEKVAFPLTADR